MGDFRSIRTQSLHLPQRSLGSEGDGGLIWAGRQFQSHRYPPSRLHRWAGFTRTSLTCPLCHSLPLGTVFPGLQRLVSLVLLCPPRLFFLRPHKWPLTWSGTLCCLHLAPRLASSAAQGPSSLTRSPQSLSGRPLVARATRSA